MKKIGFLLFLFVFTHGGFAENESTPEILSFILDKSSKNCPSGWEDKKTSPRNHLATNGFSRGFTIETNKTISHENQYSNLKIRPSFNNKIVNIKNIIPYSIKNNLTVRENSGNQNNHSFKIGHHASYGLMSVKKNTYTFCLKFELFSEPVFSPPELLDQSVLIHSTQNHYLFNGEVSVLEEVKTNFVLGDLIITIYGEN
jgi:hypothetical protein